MYHKLSVKRLVKNTDNIPLKNEDGSIVTENRKVTGWEYVSEGDPPIRKLVAKEEFGEFPVIPSWIIAETITIYQQIENENSHIAYYDEQGKEFSLLSHKEVFETSVDETDIIPPFSK